MKYQEFKNKWPNKTDLEIARMSGLLTAEEIRFVELEDKLLNGYYWSTISLINHTAGLLAYHHILTTEEAEFKRQKSLKYLREKVESRKQDCLLKNPNKNVDWADRQIEELDKLITE